MDNSVTIDSVIMSNSAIPWNLTTQPAALLIPSNDSCVLSWLQVLLKDSRRWNLLSSRRNFSPLTGLLSDSATGLSSPWKHLYVFLIIWNLCRCRGWCRPARHEPVAFSQNDMNEVQTQLYSHQGMFSPWRSPLTQPHIWASPSYSSAVKLLFRHHH